MKLLCAPQDYPFAGNGGETVEVVLYGHADIQTRGSAGAAIKDEINAIVVIFRIVSFGSRCPGVTRIC